jgi:hypothetical protein
LIHLAKCFREEDFLEINQSETRIAFGQMTKTWWEAPMGGSILSFLKAE